MRKELLILLVLIVCSCSDNKSEKSDIAIDEKSQSEQNWTEYNSKDSIPDILQNALIKVSNDNFELADPNEPFNATDVISDSIPRQKLTLLCSKNNTWRLAYIQGGFGKYNVLIESEIQKDSIVNFKIGETLLTLDNNDSISKYLSEKDLVLKRVILH